MADLSSTNRDASQEEWIEQLATLMEINGYNPEIECMIAAEEAFFNGETVSDYFYDNYEAD